jgi:outer membrane protein assembly factor BamB
MGTRSKTMLWSVSSLVAVAGVLSCRAAVPAPAGATSGPDVTTYHYDNTREGLNAHETVLTPARVNATSFGLLGVYPVDGKVDAQPLYLGGLKLSGGAAANVVYVASEHDSVYALNAATGAQIWKRSMLRPGETTSDAHNCEQIIPEIGITGTPVIDRSYGSHGAIFFVAMTKDGSGGYHQRLHALDLTTGAELAGSPTEIVATYPGTGQNSHNGAVIFAPGQYAERVGLTLVNGTLYLAWTSHCDIDPYTAWVMGYSEKTLAQTTVLNITPNGSEGAIWMSGYDVAADTSGNLYMLSGNGTFDTKLTPAGLPSMHDYGNAMLKLSTAGGLAVKDYFEPYNTIAESKADTDLGSGGAMLLPDSKDASGTTRHLLVGAGKDGSIYVGDTAHLGKFNQGKSDNSNIYQEVPKALPGGAWSGPAYFNNTVYYAGVRDVLRAFAVTNAKLSATPTSTSAASFAYPGATPSVSANGTQDGIVWAVESATNKPAVLHAYDAADLKHELYNSSQAANGRDSFGKGNKFITPVVANGHVFIGTPSGVAVFGLLKRP